MQKELRTVMTEAERTEFRNVVDRIYRLFPPEKAADIRRSAAIEDARLEDMATRETEEFLIGLHAGFYQQAVSMMILVRGGLLDIRSADTLSLLLPTIEMAICTRGMLDPFCPGEMPVDLSGIN